MEPLPSRQAAIERAVLDPEFHRAEFTRRPLLWPQVKAVKMVEQAMARAVRDAHAKSETLIVRSARQTMKNEVAGCVHVRHLSRNQKVGGTILRTAPTYKPQLVNSKMRLEREINRDPFIDRRRLRHREGNIVQYGEAQVQFLSTDPNSRVEGATASTLLDIDEGHLVDRGSFEEKFGPMTAMFAAPTVMYGVAADKGDLLYEYLCYNLGGGPGKPPKAPEELGLAGEMIDRPDLGVLQFPASVWIEFLPRYRAHYEARVAKLGKDNPWVQTQYDLLDIDKLGGFFKQYMVNAILRGDHGARRRPRLHENLEHICVIDIAGEDEEETLDFEQMSEGARDSTVQLIFEVDHDPDLAAKHNGLPTCRLVYANWWVGKTLAADPHSGLPGQQELMLETLKAFNCERTVVDGRGVGLQTAKFLEERHDGVLVYVATQQSVSEDCYSLLGLCANDVVKCWKEGTERLPSGGLPGLPPRDERLAACRDEFAKQLRTTQREIVGHELIAMVKPKRGGHIDFAKALSYLPRAMTIERPTRPGLIRLPFTLWSP